MAQPVFYLRADNPLFKARRSVGGSLLAGVANLGKIVTYDTDGTTIGGHCINIDQSSTSAHLLNYSMRGVLTTAAISVFMRVKFSTTLANRGIFEIGCGFSQPCNLHSLWLSSAPQWKAIIKTQAAATIANNLVVYSTDPATGVWIDLCFTSTGDTTSNGLKLWIDGSNVGSATLTGNATSPKDAQLADYLSIGAISGITSTRMKIEEFGIWPYVIDPTSMDLESGTGSLSGATRTSLLSVVPFSGSQLYSRGRVINAS